MSKIVLKFKIYDVAMSLVEYDSRTSQPIKEQPFNYNEYVDTNGEVLTSKYFALLSQFFGKEASRT